MKISYQFQFSKKAELDFAHLERSWQIRILKKIKFFEQSPNPLVHAKRLTGYDHYFRFRVGDYRILVSPEQDGTLVILVIVKIAHRREVYE